ncbi:glutamate receptor ionotropic, kainate 4-like [Amphibalanus amphitrite]|uniref:glutamate receptor ionotropic, kainate 4-like n=1 Tax=Amphibalanus amphitrite TaxID=1232801 RepID=UPI001C9250B4|nr:glutamate receptor ionotropic, kainate 4-like [Amphibalanus amphitrite]
MERVGSLVRLGNFSDVYTEELKIANFHDPPFLYVEKIGEGRYNYSGYLLDLWDVMCRELNVTYRMLPPSPGGFGALLTNGTWTGMVGEVVSQRADVALSWLHYRRDRAAVLEYLDMVPVFSASYDFFLRAGERDAPQLSGDVFSSLLRPLHTNVWLLLLLSMLVLSVGLTLTVRLNRGRGETESTCRQFSLGSSVLAIFMTVTGQGWSVLPACLSARTVTISSWVLGILISINYTANLMSFLTVSRPEAPISSLDEFSARDDWTFAMESGVGIIGDWAKSASASERHLYRRVVTGERFLALNGTPEVMARAARPNTLLYYNMPMLFKWLEEDACHLLPLRKKHPHRREEPNYLVLRRGLGALRNRMNKLLQRLLQSGAVDRLRRRWFGHGRRLCAAVAAVRPLTLADLAAVLAVTPLAAAAGCLLLGVELLVRRLSRRRDQQRRQGALGEGEVCDSVRGREW